MSKLIEIFKFIRETPRKYKTKDLQKKFGKEETQKFFHTVGHHLQPNYQEHGLALTLEGIKLSLDLEKSSKEKNIFSKEWWLGIVIGTIIAGLLGLLLQFLVSSLVPQFSFTLDIFTLVQFFFVLYIVLSIDGIKSGIDKINIIRSSTIIRVVGGLFWVVFGLLLISNQIQGKTDPTLHPYIVYLAGGFFGLVGIFQVMGIYDLVKGRVSSAMSIIIHGEDYMIERIWEKLIYDTHSEDDEQYKNELIQKTAEKVETMWRKGELSKTQYNKMLSLIEKSKKMNFEDFSEAYLDTE